MDGRIRKRIGNGELTPVFKKRILNFHKPDKE
jgi:hypothetical protein